MEVIYGRHDMRKELGPSVVTIGNFDGVHLGHRAVIDQLAQIAARAGVPSTLVTFEPQPREFLTPDDAPPRLLRFREKMAVLKSTRLHRVVCLKFDQTLSELSPGSFVNELLCTVLGAQHVVVGDDFRFGHQGVGDYTYLKAVSERRGFALSRCDSFLSSGRRISSSWVREALAQGNTHKAFELLGRRYAMCGRVVRGRQLGRTLGFPTANIEPQRTRVALQGIFAVRVRGQRIGERFGIASLGHRPTVEENLVPLLEVHLFDFTGDLYGQEIQVEFLDKIRDEERFDSLLILERQMHADAAAARAIIARHATP